MSLFGHGRIIPAIRALQLQTNRFESRRNDAGWTPMLNQANGHQRKCRNVTPSQKCGCIRLQGIKVNGAAICKVLETVMMMKC